MNYLNINNVSKIFLNNDKKINVLENIILSADKGDFISIIGQSGCGKTTLLRIIAGLESVSSGEVICNGVKISKPNMKYAYVFQDFNQLLPWKTVKQNIIYPLELKKYNKEEIDNRINELLYLVELTDYANYFPHILSGGMKQRVAIARALAMEPEILFMDEPFSALDAQTREKLNQELFNIWKRLNLTIVFVTHNLDEAIFLSNKIVVMGNKPGKIINIIENNVEGHKMPSDKGYSELWNLLHDSIKY